MGGRCSQAGCGARCRPRRPRRLKSACRAIVSRVSWQQVHVELHLQDVRDGLSAGLGVVDDDSAVGVPCYQVGPAAHGET